MLKLVRKRKYSGKELTELAKRNPDKVIKYKKQHQLNSETFIIRVQYKGDDKFLVLHSDDSGGIENSNWEFDYGYKKSNEIVDYYKEDLTSRFEEKRQDLLDYLKNTNIKTSEIIVNAFYRGLAITGNEKDIIDAGFSNEAIEEASCMIIKNR